MFEFATQHQFWTAVVVYWIFSAAVSAMPEPSPDQARPSGPEPASSGNSGYLWLFRFLHTVAGNITTAFGNRLPGLKTIVFLLLIPFLFTNTACASAHYTVRPGALNQTDSAAYDTLLIAEIAIDEARLQYQTGQLPKGAKDALDTLIRSYDVAREAWLTYRGAIATNVVTTTYFDQLNKNILALSNAIRTLEEAK